MIDLEAIRQAAVLRREGADYVVESPLAELVMGVGDTPEEAWRIFNEILEDAYDNYKAGRPSKGYPWAGA